MEEYTNSNTRNQPNVRFVAFRNIMMPTGNIHNFQNDYNNTDVKIELMDETDNQLLDNSYDILGIIIQKNENRKITHYK